MSRENFLRHSKSVIAMIHVDALPGTPEYGGSPGRILEKAVEEALIYKDAGVDCIGIENMHDIPYLRREVGPEIVAMMTGIGREVKKAAGIPTGIQILAGANKEALAVAQAAELDFIRAEGFVFAHVADEGIIEGCAGELLRYRKIIGADKVLILTDIKKKHSSHALTSDIDIAETAIAAEFFQSDGVVVTGVATGKPASLEELKSVRESVGIPVLVGSGVNLENVASYLEWADALIVGTYFKRDGCWRSTVDPGRVRPFMEKVREVRRK